MELEFGDTVVRLRRQRVTDPYNPQRETFGRWAEASETPIPGAFVDSGPTNPNPEGTREGFAADPMLHLTDPDADLLPTDRIRHRGVEYAVDGIPQSPKNPFTGWQPLLTVPLREVRG